VTSSAVNPRGCWDWWGYTGLHFLERDAPQMLAVRRMLSRLAERP
jgi:poly(3-hydroxybutyrate) depolymerase